VESTAGRMAGKTVESMEGSTVGSMEENKVGNKVALLLRSLLKEG
jgi:hypothetical protein